MLNNLFVRLRRFGTRFCLCAEQIKPVPQGYGSEAPIIEKEPPDIVDDAAYSIQEDKLKTEDDNRQDAIGYLHLQYRVKGKHCTTYSWKPS